MKLLRVSDDAEKAMFDKLYDFEVIKTNLVPKLNIFQVLYSLREEGSDEKIPLKETILYLHEYEIDRTPHSKFMNLLEWACYKNINNAYFLDTELIEGYVGICQLEEEKDKTINFRILGAYITNISAVSGTEL